MTEQDSEFRSLIKKLSEHSHGVLHFNEVKILLQKFKNTSARIQFLNKYLGRDQITWPEVKARVWDSEKLQNDNRFHFLQGDVIESTFIKGIGASLSGSDHSLWLVLSPDCDCVRASYVKVAPIFAVDQADHLSYQACKGDLSLAANFKSPRLFPVGGDIFGKGIDGYYIDTTEPYFLSAEDKDSVVVHFSMREEGWHLLNGFLKESETRANLDEGSRLREVLSDTHVVA